MTCKTQQWSMQIQQLFGVCIFIVFLTMFNVCRSLASDPWSTPPQTLSEMISPAMSPWWWRASGWPRGIKSSTPGSTSCCVAPSFAKSTSSRSARHKTAASWAAGSPPPLPTHWIKLSIRSELIHDAFHLTIQHPNTTETHADVGWHLLLVKTESYCSEFVCTLWLVHSTNTWMIEQISKIFIFYFFCFYMTK